MNIYNVVEEKVKISKNENLNVMELKLEFRKIARRLKTPK